MPRDTLRKRGSAMLSAMEQYKIVWQSDLPQKTKLDRYDSLVVSKGIWGLHVLSALATDFAYLEYIHVRCLRRILLIYRRLLLTGWRCLRRVLGVLLVLKHWSASPIWWIVAESRRCLRRVHFFRIW